MGVCLLKETANACASAGPVFSIFVQPSLTMDRNVFECCRSSNVCASAVAALLPSSNSRISLFINHQHLHLRKHGRPRLTRNFWCCNVLVNQASSSRRMRTCDTARLPLLSASDAPAAANCGSVGCSRSR
jgi:hypothetical protein